MNRIILFRYHHQFQRNRELLGFMKFLNPGVEIYGLYGGQEELAERASDELKEMLTHNYVIRYKSNDWKWKNSDQAFQLWFRDVGRHVQFDMLHTFEWDMLYFAPLDVLFHHIPIDAAAFTGLIPLKKIEKKWYWTSNYERREEWFSLLGFFRENFLYDSEPFGMIGPGTSLPRIFLEKLMDFNIPEMLHDEIRLPLLAQLFGIEIRDTYFFHRWFSPSEYRFFNSNEYDIEMSAIKKQLKKRNGRRAFHPYRKEITCNELMDLYNMISDKSNPPKTIQTDVARHRIIEYFFS